MNHQIVDGPQGPSRTAIGEGTERVKLCVECHGERKGTHKLCYTCRSRKRREQDPVWDVYYNVRSNAKRRGIRFALTFTWFKKFILGTEYMDKRGRDRDSLSIDRRINALGYVDGNLQILTLQANARKGSSDWGRGTMKPGPGDPF